MDMRETFVAATGDILDDSPRAALVLADITAAAFGPAAARHPDRVLNMGIRESLMVSAAGGLALAGLRPIAHSYAPFLVERAFEQIKLDFGHQGSTGVLVSIGGSYDVARGGRTHQAPGDVALLDTLPGWSIQVPGHPGEVTPMLRAAVAGDDSVYLRLSVRTNRQAHPEAARALLPLRTGGRALVVAVGTALDAVLAATADLDVSVAYTTTVRPLDAAGLRALADDTVVVVEPYLAGTSSRQVAAALAGRPHRTLELGVPRVEPRVYGEATDHDQRYGLDPAGIRRSITEFLD